MNHIPQIIIKPVQPENQRFAECGDWFYDREADTVTIFVSRMDDWRSELAVALHEALEAVACIMDDIDQTDIDAFDKQFYKEHNDDNEEAGNDPAAPYFNQHAAATRVEKEAVAQMGLDWDAHTRNCDEA